MKERASECETCSQSSSCKDKNSNAICVEERMARIKHKIRNTVFN